MAPRALSSGRKQTATLDSFFFIMEASLLCRISIHRYLMMHAEVENRHPLDHRTRPVFSSGSDLSVLSPFVYSTTNHAR